MDRKRHKEGKRRNSKSLELPNPKIPNGFLTARFPARFQGFIEGTLKRLRFARNSYPPTHRRFVQRMPWDLGFGIFLRFGIWVLGFSLFFLTGCLTKAKAREQARAAFIAGQQSAMMRLSQQKPVVTFIAQVQIPSIPWTEGLTLARAIVNAGYTGKDPKQIFIVRGGQAVPVDPKQLLSGEDVPLQAGDLVQILQ